MQPISTATLSWRDGNPYAEDYGDIYYSDDGPNEVARVFLTPSNLEDRAKHSGALVVGELGFGTGLNFVECARLVLAEPDTRLHFISFEQHPLAATDWRKLADLHKRSPRETFYNNLCEPVLPALTGWHRRQFHQGRITLSVFHGDASQGLEEVLASRLAVDAWFLDGFAPDKNPTLWHADLLSTLSDTSSPGATVATFTSKGQVRRDLESAGFTMRKVDQRPHKRESLAGVLASAGRHADRCQDPVVIHGAGLAGAVVARHFADQGQPVQVLDPEWTPDPQPTAIDKVVLHARLLGDGSRNADHRATAFHYASAYLQDHLLDAGVIQTMGPNLDVKKLHRISDRYAAASPSQSQWLQLLQAPEAQALTGVPDLGQCLYFPTAGPLALQATRLRLLDHPAIEVRRGSGINEDALNILCAGSATREMADLQWLEITDIHGQLDQVLIDTPPRKSIVGNGYLIPDDDGAVIGSTYEYQPWPVNEASAHNLKLNEHLLDGKVLPAGVQRGRRCVASDRTPLVGAVKDNVWLATAHGSMGTTSAPLAAAILLSDYLGWPRPCSTEVSKALDPLRFRERQARRGMRHGATPPHS